MSATCFDVDVTTHFENARLHAVREIRCLISLENRLGEYPPGGWTMLDYAQNGVTYAP